MVFSALSAFDDDRTETQHNSTTTVRIKSSTTTPRTTNPKFEIFDAIPHLDTTFIEEQSTSFMSPATQLVPLGVTASPSSSSVTSSQQSSEETTTESFLELIEKQGSHSSVHILQHSVNLLKKLIMLSASDLGVDELPEFLKDILKTDANNIVSSLVQESTTTKSVVTTSSSSSVSEEPSSSSSKSIVKKGRKNFKHSKFTAYYRKLKAKQEELATVNFQDDIKSDLLVSLRHQLTESALNNDKLKAKANRVPIYQPRRRTNISVLREIYKSRGEDAVNNNGFNQEFKAQLSDELQEALKIQLERLESDLARKRLEEEREREISDQELTDSLKSQFSSLFRNLGPEESAPAVLDDEDLVSDSELKTALEDQLRVLFSP